MEVIAVSLSVPQWLEMGGRRVHTSIIHTPLTRIDEFITVKPSQGVKGNKSAAHNGEVYIFFAHHYDYWAEKLGVVRKSWDWCHWGENITFQCDSKITEADFHLGDVWKIGHDVVLQVCGSRVPCFKLAWRCGQKDSWLQELASTGKCGVYLKVIQGGRIYPGDVAELLSKRSSGPKIDCATITRVAFADAVSTQSTMNLLADDPDLLDMNKLIFRRKLSMLYDQQLVGRGSWKGWRSVSVSRVEDESPDIRSFYMTSDPSSSNDSPLATFLPGQFITVRLPNGLVRSWSLSTYPDVIKRESPEVYRISIRKAGVGSTWMHENCIEGTTLEIQSPAGSFCLDWSPQFPGRQVYASAGIGITPMISMLRAHLQHQAMQRAPAVWIHISRRPETMPFRGELEELLRLPAAQELGIHVMLFFTAIDPSEGDAIETSLTNKLYRGIQVSVYAGRPTLDSLRSLFSKSYFMDPLRITPIEIEGKFSTVYLCGPSAFEETMREILSSLEVPDPMILSEAFSGDPGAAVPSSIEEAEVCFLESDKTATWRKEITAAHSNGVQDENGGTDSAQSGGMGPSLLELAEELGLAPEFGCRTGVCGSCEVSLCKGKVTAGLQPGGMVRICVARPSTDRVELRM